MDINGKGEDKSDEVSQLLPGGRFGFNPDQRRLGTPKKILAEKEHNMKWHESTQSKALTMKWCSWFRMTS